MGSAGKTASVAASVEQPASPRRGVASGMGGATPDRNASGCAQGVLRSRGSVSRRPRKGMRLPHAHVGRPRITEGRVGKRCRRDGARPFRYPCRRRLLLCLVCCMCACVSVAILARGDVSQGQSPVYVYCHQLEACLELGMGAPFWPWVVGRAQAECGPALVSCVAPPTSSATMAARIRHWWNRMYSGVVS